MSEAVSDQRILSAEQLAEAVTALAAARNMVSDLCHRRREWTMSVPAMRDYDPAIVISRALNWMLRLENHIATLTKQHAAELARVTKERDEAVQQALSRVLAAEYREGEWQNRCARAEAELAALKAERAEDTELSGNTPTCVCGQGHRKYDAWKFCPNCGRRLKWIDAARAAGKEGEK